MATIHPNDDERATPGTWLIVGATLVLLTFGLPALAELAASLA